MPLYPGVNSVEFEEIFDENFLTHGAGFSNLKTNVSEVRFVWEYRDPFRFMFRRK
jgi:hypothetical protein